jgi:hypothetical protein
LRRKRSTRSGFVKLAEGGRIGFAGGDDTLGCFLGETFIGDEGTLEFLLHQRRKPPRFAFE